jgi:hypothetical protein
LTAPRTTGWPLDRAGLVLEIDFYAAMLTAYIAAIEKKHGTPPNPPAKAIILHSAALLLCRETVKPPQRAIET